MIQKIRQQSWEMRLHLAERKEKTIFLKLANQIIQEILSGRLRQGTRLQGSRTLADELGINRKTVQSVYEDLEAQGWLVSKPRQGTFVSEHLPDLKLESPTIPMTLAQSATESSIPQEAIKND
ncbi:winged helix-turn-helix transcriptional regulator, partial [Acinetobacter baumannii]